jgi:hypothetical protein
MTPLRYKCRLFNDAASEVAYIGRQLQLAPYKTEGTFDNTALRTSECTTDGVTGNQMPWSSD